MALKPLLPNGCQKNDPASRESARAEMVKFRKWAYLTIMKVSLTIPPNFQADGLAKVKNGG